MKNILFTLFVILILTIVVKMMITGSSLTKTISWVIGRQALKARMLLNFETMTKALLEFIAMQIPFLQTFKYKVEDSKIYIYDVF